MLRANGSDLSEELLQSLTSSLQGEVIVKGKCDEERYQKTIARWNMLHVKEANIITLPENEQDISTVIKFAVEHDLDVTVSAGRHTYSGASSGYGLVIDLRNIRHISLDRATKTITAGGGCLAGELEKAADDVGLRAVFGAINETGIGGITTGGGIGNLSGKYGLVADSLLSARVALADGSIVVASADENPDLFWGIRGGGGNFGICTEFTYRLYDSPGLVYSGIFIYAKDQFRASCEIANKLHYESILPSKGKLSILFNYAALTGPNHVPVWSLMYDGPEEEAKRLLAPLFDLKPSQVMAGMVPYPTVTSYEPLKPMYAPDFNRFLASSVQMPWPLDVEVMDFYAQEFEKVVEGKDGRARPSMLSFDLRDYRKVAERPKDETAYVHRVDGCMGMIDMAWNDPAIDDAMIKETKEVLANVRKLLTKKGAHKKGEVITIEEWDKGPKQHAANGHVEITSKANGGNKEDDPEEVDEGHLGATTLYALLTDGKEKMASVFGSNYPRLRELKAKYDPGCLWNKWYPIEPAVGG